MAGTRKNIWIAVIILALLIVALGVATRLSAQQNEANCEFPLFIQQAGAQANVLFVFDNSGSMNEVMFHDDYDPDSVYSGSFKETNTYYVSMPGSYTPRSFNFSYPSTPSAYLVNSDHGEDGRYYGNYMNWIYFHATDAQRAAIPRVTRIQVAKPAVADIITNTDNIRFGIMEFNYEQGGHLVAGLGTSESQLISSLYGIAGTTWTPLAETMVDVLEHFQTGGTNPAIEYWCQKNFVVVVTDGFPTMDRNVPSYIGDYDHDGNDPGSCASIGAPYPSNNDCSDYLDDVALYLHENDMRSDLEGMQNVFTYTIGFNIDAGILQETADHGGGLYLNAYNAQELQATLKNILNDIINRVSSGSAVAVVSQETQESDRLFRGKFVPQTWRGYLEAFELPYSYGQASIWEAGEKLRARDPVSRTILTALDGQMTEFSESNASVLQPYLGTASVDTAADIINLVRGHEIDGYRDRDGWKLGDIIDSSPVVVGAPSHFYEFLDYNEFRAGYLDREQVIYIGANDGMLHCFRASDGYEKWAFIPSCVLGNLKQLADSTYCHTYYVNLTPTAADVHINGAWRTILIGGEKEGGSEYFALDITYPDSPMLLWETSLSIERETWSQPLIARVESENGFVAFFGSGPDPNGEAYLAAVDLETGNELWSELLSTSSSLNMATAPAKVDLDVDDFDDLLYVADMAGKVSRIDIKESPWTKTVIFETNNQPIQAEPILTVDLEDQVYLYFGTGKYMEPDDVFDTSLQTFYCVTDNHSGGTVSRSDLVDQTYQINPITNDKRGWLVDLVLAPGERIIKPDALVAGVVYFSSFQPSTDICSAGGRSWLYGVDYIDGSAPDQDDGSEDDTTEGRVEDLGTGITSKPVIDLVNEKIIVQSSDTKINILDAKTAIRHLIVRSWRPLFQ